MACALRLGPLAMSPKRISDALVLLGRPCGTAWLFNLFRCGVGHALAGGEKMKRAQIIENFLQYVAPVSDGAKP